MVTYHTIGGMLKLCLILPIVCYKIQIFERKLLMILDYLTRLDTYKNTLPNLVEAVRFGMEHKDSEVGRYEMGDTGCFVLVQELETKPASEKLIELHKNYLDVHIVLSGEEVLEYEDIAKLTAADEYNALKDIQFLNGDGQAVLIKPEMFCVVFPHDGHKPGCCKDAPSKLRKLVVKVPCKEEI